MALNCATTSIENNVNLDRKQCCRTEKPFFIKKEELQVMKTRYPTKIPVLLERYYKERNLPIINKRKFLVPEDYTMLQFLAVIRQKINISRNQAIYLLVNEKCMLSMSLTMAQAYVEYATEDGFLYITYASQEVFGYKEDMKESQAMRSRFPDKVPLHVHRYVL